MLTQERHLVMSGSGDASHVLTVQNWGFSKFLHVVEIAGRDPALVLLSESKWEQVR